MKDGLNVIVTVGNEMRMDDGVGSFIYSRLTSNEALKIINASSMPENIIDEVVNLKPDHILFIDAANFGGYPGEIRIIEKSDIAACTLSTHQIPLNLIADIIEAETKADICILGIQIQNSNFGEGLSPKIKKSAEKIIRMIEDPIVFR